MVTTVPLVQVVFLLMSSFYPRVILLSTWQGSFMHVNKMFMIRDWFNHNSSGLIQFLWVSVPWVLPCSLPYSPSLVLYLLMAWVHSSLLLTTFWIFFIQISLFFLCKAKKLSTSRMILSIGGTESPTRILFLRFHKSQEITKKMSRRWSWVLIKLTKSA